MTVRTCVLDHWPQLRSSLPAGFDVEATARARGAFLRARGVENADTLLRLALAYGGCGMSLRETCAWAEAGAIACLSDPSLLERLCKAGPWLGDLVAALIGDRVAVSAPRLAGYRLRALDGTSICEPGADRTTWRLHVGYDLASGQVDQIELTDGRGAESLRRLICQPGDIVLADRYYARPRDLRPVIEAGAHFIVRCGWNSLRLLREDGAAFDLFAALAAQAEPEGEVLVRVEEGRPARAGAPLIVRLVIRRKSPEQTRAEQDRLLKDAKKRGRTPDPRSLQAAGYILLLTTLSAEIFPAAQVLGLYRLRWQIELAFKRMKSLGGLDALPAKTPALARAWIYARLIAILLAEQSAGQVPDSSPCASATAGAKPVTLAPRQNGAGQHSRRYSKRRALAHHRQRSPSAAPPSP